MVERYLEKICFFSLEWKTEGVMDDGSEDDGGNEGEEDWLNKWK